MATLKVWSKAALQQLITDGVQESLTLDYKRGAALTPKTDGIKNEISKDVSAFANSAGGTIIYGIAEENNRPLHFDGLDSAIVTREWLDQVIASRIQQRIDGVRIVEVDLLDGSVAYVVEVPQSNRAPHMAADHRYYKRFEYRSAPMEEYEVRDVGRRVHSPLLRVQVSLAQSHVTYAAEATMGQLTLHASVGNDGPVPAEYAVVRLVLDERVEGVPQGFAGPTEAWLSSSGGSMQKVRLWQLNWNVPAKLPIWDGIDFRLCDTPLTIQVPRGEGRYSLGWSVTAPRMTKVGKLLHLAVGSDGLAELIDSGRPLML